MSKITREEAKYIDGTLEWALDHLEFSNLPNKAINILKQNINQPTIDNKQVMEDLESIRFRALEGRTKEQQFHLQVKYNNITQYISQLEETNKISKSIIKNMQDDRLSQKKEIEGQKSIVKEVADTCMETIHELNNKLDTERERSLALVGTLDKIRKMVNSDTPMSYRLAMVKVILEGE